MPLKLMKSHILQGCQIALLMQGSCSWFHCNTMTHCVTNTRALLQHCKRSWDLNRHEGL